MSKIFVRHRGRVEQGAGRPRFEIVGVQGIDLNVFHTHLRRVELEAIATEIGAELVYLPRGKNAPQPETEGQRGRRHRGKPDKG